MGELPRHKLSDAELQEALKSLPGWKAEKDKLHREYKFDDFIKAWGFMASVALVAESMSIRNGPTSITRLFLIYGRTLTTASPISTLTWVRRSKNWRSARRLVN
jgi:hypothetical protein